MHSELGQKRRGDKSGQNYDDPGDTEQFLASAERIIDLAKIWCYSAAKQSQRRKHFCLPNKIQGGC